MPILHVISRDRIKNYGYVSINGGPEIGLRNGCYLLPADLRSLEYHTLSPKKRPEKSSQASDEDIRVTFRYKDEPEKLMIELYIFAEGRKLPYGPGYREYIAEDDYYKLRELDAGVLQKTLRTDVKIKAKKRRARKQYWDKIRNRV